MTDSPRDTPTAAATAPAPVAPSYQIIWEFEVNQGQERSFEKTYGKRGPWARLLAKGEGHIGSELLICRDQPGRYLTIDRWESLNAYETFHRKHAAASAKLDDECAGLTKRESRVGQFDLK